MMQKGKKIQIIVVVLIVLAVVWAVWSMLFVSTTPAATATVWVDGNAAMEVELTQERQYTTLEHMGLPVNFEVEGGRIRFVDVTCPDEICMNTGWLELEGQTAICMPNRVSLTVDE